MCKLQKLRKACKNGMLLSQRYGGGESDWSVLSWDAGRKDPREKSLCCLQAGQEIERCLITQESHGPGKERMMSGFSISKSKRIALELASWVSPPHESTHYQ